MSYNGIGLSTARGTGTNGFVQRNISYVKPRHSGTANFSGRHNSASVADWTGRRANKDILLHEKKRQVEVKCLELRDLLERKGTEMSPEEIDEKISALRSELLAAIELELGGDSSGKSVIDTSTASESHRLAEIKEQENLKLAKAFGIDPTRPRDGKSFERTAVDQKQLARQRQSLERELEDLRSRTQEIERKEVRNHIEEDRNRGRRQITYSRSRSRTRSPSLPLRRRRKTRSPSPPPRSRKRSITPSPPPRSRKRSITPPPKRRYRSRSRSYSRHRTRSPPRSHRYRSSRSVSRDRDDYHRRRSPSQSRGRRSHHRSPLRSISPRGRRSTGRDRSPIASTRPDHRENIGKEKDIRKPSSVIEPFVNPERLRNMNLIPQTREKAKVKSPSRSPPRPVSSRRRRISRSHQRSPPRKGNIDSEEPSPASEESSSRPASPQLKTTSHPIKERGRTRIRSPSPNDKISKTTRYGSKSPEYNPANSRPRKHYSRSRSRSLSLSRSRSRSAGDRNDDFSIRDVRKTLQRKH